MIEELEASPMARLLEAVPNVSEIEVAGVGATV